MAPTYSPGDVLLGWRWFRPHLGQVVVVQTPDRKLIKRIKTVQNSGYWVEGDNPARSIDSRSFGTVDRKQIQALIIAKLS